jgi:hypothetical protein
VLPTKKKKEEEEEKKMLATDSQNPLLFDSVRRENSSCFFFLQKTFLLVYDSYTARFVVTYPSLSYPLHYSLSCPTPLLKVTSTGFHVPCSHVLRKYLSHLHPPLPFLYPPSPTSDLPLM